MDTDSVRRKVAQLFDAYLVQLSHPGEGQVCVSGCCGSERVALVTFTPRILQML